MKKANGCCEKLAVMSPWLGKIAAERRKSMSTITIKGWKKFLEVTGKALVKVH